MAIPICDGCAKRELGDLYEVINFNSWFHVECISCDKVNMVYAIPVYSKKEETGLEAVKRYLSKEMDIVLNAPESYLKEYGLLLRKKLIEERKGKE